MPSTVSTPGPPLEPQIQQDLAGWIRQVAPARTLAIGQRAREWMAIMPPGRQLECLASREALAVIQHAGAYDLVVVTDTIEHMEKPAAEQLLGRLRDLHAHHLFVLAPIGEIQPGQASIWMPGDLLALGLFREGSYVDGAVHYQLYHFALETYKQVPDWLNSKYWAHPERFDVNEE